MNPLASAIHPQNTKSQIRWRLISTAQAEELSATEPAESTGGISSLSDLLSDLPSVTADNLLEVDQAFQFDVAPVGESSLLDIRPGC